MAEYIDREIAKGSLRMNQHRFTCADEANGFGSVRWSEDVIYAEAAQKAIDTIPSADVVEVRHGEWLPDVYAKDAKTGYEYLTLKCSVCGCGCISRNNFCHRCGADMRMDGE